MNPLRHLNDNLKASNIIAVTSGKGGVGKSTITALLAKEYVNKNFTVGVIDLDIFGFSIHKLFKINEKAIQVNSSHIKPIVKNSIHIISMGMFIDSNEVVAWRGPLLHRFVTKILNETKFPQLDYLFLDLPPGTGDIAISMAHILPSAQFIIITTPDINSANVAIRSGILAVKMGHNIIGVIENMSYFREHNGKKKFIFGTGGGIKIADSLKTKIIAQLPIEENISVDSSNILSGISLF